MILWKLFFTIRYSFLPINKEFSKDHFSSNCYFSTLIIWFLWADSGQWYEELKYRLNPSYWSISFVWCTSYISHAWVIIVLFCIYLSLRLKLLFSIHGFCFELKPTYLLKKLVQSFLLFYDTMALRDRQTDHLIRIIQAQFWRISYIVLF